MGPIPEPAIHEPTKRLTTALKVKIWAGDWGFEPRIEFLRNLTWSRACSVFLAGTAISRPASPTDASWELPGAVNLASGTYFGFFSVEN